MTKKSDAPAIRFKGFSDAWEQRKLSELTSMHARIGWQNLRTSEFLDSGDYMLITGTDFNDGAINFSTCHYVERERYEQDRNIQIHNGSILITKDGTLGKVAYVQGLSMPATLNAGVFNVQIKDANNVDERYLFQYLKAPFLMDYVDKKATGGTIKHLNQSILVDFPVILPQRSEQILIGAFFQQLDNLITLHQRKCVFLFGFFQAVISMIFTASTFSWEQRKLGEIGSVSMCRRIFKEQTSETGDIPFYKIGTFGAEPDAFISRELFEEYKSKYPYPKKGDILISASGSIGRTVEFSGNNEYFQDSNIVWLSHDERLSNSFLKCFYSVVKWVGIEGSTIKRLYNDNILNTVICMPSVPEQEHIGLFFENLDNLITLHQRECISFTARAGRRILTANKKRNTSSWEQRKLGELVDRVVRKNTNNESTLPLTISAQYGLVDQITYFNNRVASRDVSNYYLVLNGEFAYNKSTSDGYPFGAVKRLDLYEKGVLSTLYIVFAPKKEQQIDSDYLTVFFDTDRWHKGVAERAAEGARNHGLLNISAEDFFDIDLSVPKDIVEQKQIGAFIRQLDHLITLHQRKPFLMKWRTSDANRNKTNRLVL